MTEATPDNAASAPEDFHARLYGMRFRLFLDANGEPDDFNMVELRLGATVGELALFETKDHGKLHTAATVAALEAEVADRNAVIECKNIDIRERDRSLHEWAERAKAAERRVAELERVCAEAYQVVGVLLSDTDQFDTDHGEKILDNLSVARIVHEDVLPWGSKGARHG